MSPGADWPSHDDTSHRQGRPTPWRWTRHSEGAAGEQAAEDKQDVPAADEPGTPPAGPQETCEQSVDSDPPDPQHAEEPRTDAGPDWPPAPGVTDSPTTDDLDEPAAPEPAEPDRSDAPADRPAGDVSRETPGAAIADVSRETSENAPGATAAPPTNPEPRPAIGAPAIGAPAIGAPAVGPPAWAVVAETAPLDEPAAAHSPVRTAVPAGPWPAPSRRRVMAVANQKGGVGKTTSAVNIAAALALHGVRVLVIDLDPQGNAATAFDVPHQSKAPSIYDVLIGERSLAEVCVPVAEIPNLWCAPATIDLAGAEIELVSVVARETRLRRALDSIADLDYVFIDCPPSLGLLTLNAMVAASEVLIPIQCEFYALEGLTQLLSNVELVKNHLNAELTVSTILLTMYDGRTRLADQVAMEVRSHFGDLVLEPVIPRSIRVSEAPGFGQPVVTFDPASRGALTYSAAAYDLARRGQPDVNDPAQPS